jgi:predicted NUDIX family NTP pyrophosphohydrolase
MLPHPRIPGRHAPALLYNPRMPTVSAGLLMYRIRDGELQVLLVHPGGPFWAKKDAGAWTLPKGEVAPAEDPLHAAVREFEEETGLAPTGPFIELGAIKQKGGKLVQGWAFESDCDPAVLQSNTFTMEWPPRSGQTRTFPEVDRAAFFALAEARHKINPAQAELLNRLAKHLGGDQSPGAR